MDESTRGMILLDNKQITDVSVSEEDIPVKWHLYWLKKSEYNSSIHSPFNGASPHNHSFYEMQFITEGTLEYMIGDELIKLGEGDYLIVAPKTNHYSVSRSDIMKKISIGFEISYDDNNEITRQLSVLRNFPYHYGKANNFMLSTLKLILEELNERDSNQSMIKRMLLNVFLLSLAGELSSRDEKNQQEADVQPQIEMSDETVYNAIVHYLQNNIDRNITIAELSENLLISISQLNRRLIRYSGMSFSKIKDSIRCSKARELLATNMSMSQISEAIGVSNEYSFNRFFKRVEGMTPGRFRESLQTNNYK